MLNEKVAEKMLTQVNKELYSAYLYLGFANYYEQEGLDGFAHWYQIQAKEERDHALMLRRYLINNGVTVTFDAIDCPQKAFAAPVEPLKAGLEHERYVTSLINDIYAEAFAAKDFRSMQFLDWFVKEQCEEEKNAEELIKKMELFGGDSKGLYMLNQELNGRVYTATTQLDPLDA